MAYVVLCFPADTKPFFPCRYGPFQKTGVFGISVSDAIPHCRYKITFVPADTGAVYLLGVYLYLPPLTLLYVIYVYVYTWTQKCQELVVRRSWWEGVKFPTRKWHSVKFPTPAGTCKFPTESRGPCNFPTLIEMRTTINIMCSCAEPNYFCINYYEGYVFLKKTIIKSCGHIL